MDSTKLCRNHKFRSTSPSNESDPRKLRLKQRKLVLLWHASTCSYGDQESCPEFGHCQALKRLYHHIINCDGKCIVPGCKRNKRVWSHHTMCTDHQCLVCAPVRLKVMDNDRCETSASETESESEKTSGSSRACDTKQTDSAVEGGGRRNESVCRHWAKCNDEQCLSRAPVNLNDAVSDKCDTKSNTSDESDLEVTSESDSLGTTSETAESDSRKTTNTTDSETVFDVDSERGIGHFSECDDKSIVTLVSFLSL